MDYSQVTGQTSEVETPTLAKLYSTSELQIGFASIPLTALCPPPPPPPPLVPPLTLHTLSEGSNQSQAHDPTASAGQIAWTFPVGANEVGWYAAGGAYMPQMQQMTPEQRAWHMWASHQHHVWYMQNVLAWQQQAAEVKKSSGSSRKGRVTTRIHSKNSRSTSTADQTRNAQHLIAAKEESHEFRPQKRSCLAPLSTKYACADAFFTNAEEEQTDEDSYAASEASTVYLCVRMEREILKVISTCTYIHAKSIPTCIHY